VIDRGVNATFQPFAPIGPIGPPRPAPVFNAHDFWAQGMTVGLELTW
jgi:hypothetical protein